MAYIVGEVRVKTKLSNAVDEELMRRGAMKPEEIRVYEAEAVIDTGAVATVIPIHVVQKSGLSERRKRVAEFADGRKKCYFFRGPEWILRDAMNFRAFTPRDARFCFDVRCKAFIEKFYGELGPEEVSAGVVAYTPEDYIAMAEEAPFFMVEENGRRAGFFTIRGINGKTAEIPLVYIDDRHLGKGLGKACIEYIEKWIASNWPEVEVLIVDTVIPRYNGAFYRKMGFTPGEQVVCDFPDREVKALRLTKELGKKG